MSRGNYRRKTIISGHQPSASMSLSSPIRTYVRTDTHSLTCGRDICPTSQIRTEIRMKKFWTRHREARQVIGLHEVFSDYWGASSNEFTVSSQSLSSTDPRRSD